MKNLLKGKHGPLLIAEIGGNHEGDFEYAKRLCQLAIDTDVDMVKFQIYTGDSLVSREESPVRNQHFKKFELSQEQHIELAEMVQNAGLMYTSSVWDLEAMKWIDPYIPVYKIGSGDLTAFPVLKATAALGKPLIISTGLSTEQEVLEAVAYLQKCNACYKDPDMLAVLQCTSMYPINAQDAHLSVMDRYREKTHLTVGYSDHTEGSKALNYAVAMGAEILEFHFTDEREGKSFRDHKVSLMPDEVRELIQEIKLIQSLQGDLIKKPTQIELDNGHELSFRRAVYPKANLTKGTILNEGNLLVLRPNHGVDARDYEALIGKPLTQDVKEHQKLEFELLEGAKPQSKCHLCGSKANDLISKLEAKPEGETRYLPEGMNYYREIRHCGQCGVYFNAHDYPLFGEELYAGNYNAAIAEDPALSQGKLQKRFERIINLPEDSSDNKLRVGRIMDYINLAMSQDKSQLKALDVGSGTGVFPYELSKHLPKCSAVDPDGQSVELMRKNIELDNLWHGSLAQVPDEEKFDLISFNKVLEHVEDPISMLKNAKGHLSKGGVVYIELPFGEGIRDRNQQGQRAEFFIEHFCAYTYEALTYLIREAGLELQFQKDIIEPSGKETIYAFAHVNKNAQ